MARNRDRIDPVLDKHHEQELEQTVLDRRPNIDTRPPRPFGVSCIGALMFLSGMLGSALLLLIFFLGSFGSAQEIAPFSVAFAMQFFLVCSACFVGSFFVWEGFKLGWTLAAFVLILDLALALQGVTYMLLFSPQSIGESAAIPPLERHSLKLIVSAIVMAYLFSKPVRAYFQLGIREAATRVGVALLPIAALWLWSSTFVRSAS
jgi:hypothetical protein